MLKRVWVTNGSACAIFVHTEDPGDKPHPGFWVKVLPGKQVPVWVIDPRSI